MASFGGGGGGARGATTPKYTYPDTRNVTISGIGGVLTGALPKITTVTDVATGGVGTAIKGAVTGATGGVVKPPTTPPKGGGGGETTSTPYLPPRTNAPPTFYGTPQGIPPQNVPPQVTQATPNLPRQTVQVQQQYVSSGGQMIGGSANVRKPMDESSQLRRKYGRVDYEYNRKIEEAIRSGKQVVFGKDGKVYVVEQSTQVETPYKSSETQYTLPNIPTQILPYETRGTEKQSIPPMPDQAFFDTTKQFQGSYIPLSQQKQLTFFQRWEALEAKARAKGNFGEAQLINVGTLALSTGKTIAWDIPKAIIKDVIEFPSKPGEVLARGIVGQTLTFITSPRETSYKLFTEFEARPAQFTGQVAGTLLFPVATKGAFKLAKEGYIYVAGKRPTQFIPSPILKDLVQSSQTSRQRPTILLKDTKGDYILGVTKSGKAISYGGLQKKGESPLKGALRELKEETGGKTGLTRRDLQDLKKEGDFVFPEETFKVYTAKVKDLSKIRASSDVSEGIKIVSGRDVKGITGMSYKYPTTTKNGVRVYEAGIINYLETGKEPTWLKVMDKTGEFIYGTKSRYDIPPEVLAKYLKSDELLLAHGTTQGGEFTRSILSFSEKNLEVLSGKAKRGSGLYLHPPISYKSIPEKFSIGFTKPVWFKKNAVKTLNEPRLFDIRSPLKPAPGYVGISYLEIGDLTSEEFLGYTFGNKRAVYTFKERPSKLTPTMKTLTGEESEYIFDVGTKLETQGRFKSTYLSGKKIRLQPAVVVDLSLPEKKLASNLLKDLENKKLDTKQRLDIANQLKDITGIDYSGRVGRYIEITPEYLADKSRPFTISSLSKDITKASKSSKGISLSKSEPRIISLSRRDYRYSPSQAKTSPYVYSIEKEIQRYLRPTSSRYGGRPTRQYPPYPPTRTPQYPPYPPTKEPTLPFLEITEKSKYSQRKKKKGLGSSFDVFIIEKRRPKTIARGLSEPVALDIGARAVTKSLRATFGIRKSDLPVQDIGSEREFSRYRNLFREPTRKSPYRKYGRVFVQKQSKTGMFGGRLAFPQELKEIQSARRNKMERYLQ